MNDKKGRVINIIQLTHRINVYVCSEIDPRILAVIISFKCIDRIKTRRHNPTVLQRNNFSLFIVGETDHDDQCQSLLTELVECFFFLLHVIISRENCSRKRAYASMRLLILKKPCQVRVYVCVCMHGQLKEKELRTSLIIFFFLEMLLSRFIQWILFNSIICKYFE